MAYMNQERKVKIAALLKEALKSSPFKVKYTLSVRNHSTLVMTITSGNIDFIADLIPDERNIDELYKSYHLSINQYWYQEHYREGSMAHSFLSLIFPILNDGNHDNSDIMTDYFDVGWYIDVDIGRWKKPYLVTT